MKNPQKSKINNLVVVQVCSDNKNEEIIINEEDICWDGFRIVNGIIKRGVPKRNRDDCFKYCIHARCEFL